MRRGMKQTLRRYLAQWPGAAAIAVAAALGLAAAEAASADPAAPASGARATLCAETQYREPPERLTAESPSQWPAAAEDRKRLAAAFMARGNAHVDCKQLPAAIEDFEAGVEGAPGEAIFRFELGDAYVRAALDQEENGSSDKAVEYYGKAQLHLEEAQRMAAASGGDRAYHTLLFGDLGTAYLGKGDAARAVPALQQALQALGQSSETDTRLARCRWMVRLGRAQIDTGAAADARQSFQSASQALASCPDVSFWDAMAQIDLKNYDAAIDAINKLLERSGGFKPRLRAMLLTGLGHAYQMRGRNGDFLEARNRYHEALSFDPSSRAARLLATVPAPTGPPVFNPPALVNMQAIDQQQPTPRLCTAEARNDFLKSITDQVHPAYTANVATLNAYVTSLGEKMNQYWADTTLTYAEKQGFVALIKAEHDRASAQSTAIADHDKAIIGPYFAKIQAAPISHC